MKTYYIILNIETGKYLGPMEKDLFDRDIVGAGKWPTKESAFAWIENSKLDCYVQIVEIHIKSL